MVDLGGPHKGSHARSDALGFAEIVGQDELKEALLAVAANDDLDGLLVRGEKGTAKSTAVRALTDLLPPQTAVADCPYGCHPADPDSRCDDCRDRTDPPTTERPAPLVTLPLGATRERVVGSLSVADALDGDHEFEPGLLARANRGILYVDEVNLLDDHLVDVLLDAAAGGVNRVERDGVSVSHPARFTLVGTMNPEEGDLRPQLRDRFALQATVTGCDDVADRVAIIDAALDRSAPARSDAEAVGSAQPAVRDDEDATDEDAPEASGREPAERLAWAREALADVTLPASLAEDVATLCRDAGVDGHRGDIATARAARTLAALDGRTTVDRSDVRRAAGLALPHRLQTRPFEDAPDPEEVIDEHFDDADEHGEGERDADDGADGEGRGDAGGDSGESGNADASGDGDADGETDADRRAPPGTGSPAGGEPETSDDEPASNEDGATPGQRSPHPSPTGSGEGDDPHETGTDGDADEVDAAAGRGEGSDEGTPLVPGQSRVEVGEGSSPDVETPAATGEGAGRGGSRTRRRPSVDNDGPRVRTESTDADGPVDGAASVRAASQRGSETVESRDLRQSVRAGSGDALVAFAVDASASMRPAMRAAKGTVLELLRDAYQHRDEVAFVAFAGDGADVLCPPTDSVSLAARHLKDLPTGDRTPLPAGLDAAADVVDRADPAAAVVVLVTDGRANVADGSPVEATRAAARRLARLDATVLLVDAGDGGRSGLGGLVVSETDGRRVPLDALSAERVDAAVGSVDPGSR